MPKKAKKDKTDNLVNQLGLDDLSQEKKMELIMKWGDIIQKDVLMRVLKELPEESKAELDKLLTKEKDNFKEIYKFLEEKISNLDEIVKEEIEKFRKEMKESAKKVGI